MKIALLGSYPSYPYHSRLKFAYGKRPDVTTYWNYNLAKALGRYTDAEIHFFTNGPIMFTQVIEDEGTRIHFVGHPPKISRLDNLIHYKITKFHFHRLLRKLNPDIVYGIGTDHEYSYIAQTSGYPYVIKVGGVINRIVTTRNYPRFHIFHVLAKLEKQVVHRARDIITPTGYVRSIFEKDTDAEFHIVPNSVEESFFEKETTEEFDLMYAGKIYELKRFKNLVQAVLILRQKGTPASVLVAGSVHDQAYFKDIQRFIAKHRLEQSFHFLGVLSRDAYAEALSKIKMLVVPSAQETAPMVISEAMSMGKPVVGTEVGGIPDMIDNGNTGFLVESDNIEQLAEAMQQLLTDAPLREKMSRNAKTIARECYHPIFVANKNMAIFEEILNQTKQAHA